jgi:ABC-type dipeptide/oligopeptide/nickel transport system permease subunit
MTARTPEDRRLGVAGWIGIGVVAGFVVLAVAGPALAPYRVTELAGDPLEGPSLHHLFGTNSVGQDLASQLVSGARASLLIALLAGGGTLVLGAVVGAVAGWRGGRTDSVTMRTADLVLVLPPIPLMVVLGASIDPDVVGLAVIIVLVSWPVYARMVRSAVLPLRRRADLRAAVGFGAGTGQVLRRHVLPEVSLVLMAGLVSAVERAIAIEAGLAFLGLVNPTRASWGSIMRDALDFRGLFLTDSWKWWLVPPVAAIALLLVGLALVGTSLERRLDPRLSRHQPGGVSA